MDFMRFLLRSRDRGVRTRCTQTTRWIILMLILTQLFDLCSGLICWHCIAENCDINPEDNQRAERRQCLNGQICQKVVFEMQSDVDDSKYKSTVRSCSEECIAQNDYLNCTLDLYTTMGCVKRACCDDDDLCNGASAILRHHSSIRTIGVFGDLISSFTFNFMTMIPCVVTACSLLNFW